MTCTDKAAETCATCQGNGEVVTDWDRYLEGQEGDKGDEAVADCAACGGIGSVPADSLPNNLGIPILGERGMQERRL